MKPWLLLAIALPALAAEPADPVKTEKLITVEQEMETGWFMRYDSVGHRDLGDAFRAYHAARIEGNALALLDAGYLPMDFPFANLEASWRELPYVAEEEPFAVAVYTEDGNVSLSTFTRCSYEATLDLCVLKFEVTPGALRLDLGQFWRERSIPIER